jgi:hypothetical protein
MGHPKYSLEDFLVAALAIIVERGVAGVTGCVRQRTPRIAYGFILSSLFLAGRFAWVALASCRSRIPDGH